MNLILAIILMQIISQSYGSTYESNVIYLCNKYEMSSSGVFNVLKQLIQDQPQMQDNDHSIGFHYRPDICHNNLDVRNPYIKNPFTAFLSDNDHYINLFTNVLVNETIGPNIQNETLFTFNAYKLKQDFKLNENCYLVVWIQKLKFQSIDYTVEYSNVKQKTSNFANKLQQQLVFETDLNTQTIKVSNDHNSVKDITLDLSYIIICKPINDPNKRLSKCWPKITGDYVRCVCHDEDQDNETDMFIVVLFWLITAIIITKPVVEKLIPQQSRRRGDKTVFSQTVNVSERSAKYKYLICLRFATESADFSLKNVCIDFEFFTPFNESVAPQFRFEANVLEKQPMVEIKLVMWRLTRLPEVNTIVCKHNGPQDLKIILLGVLVYGMIGESEYYYCWRVNKNIVRNKRYFRLRSAKQTMTEEDIPLRQIFMSQISLSFLELVWILFLDITFIAILALYLPIGSKNKTLLDMILIIILSALLAICFNTVFIIFYKYLLVLQMREKLTMKSRNESFYSYAIICLYFISIAFALIFGLIMALNVKHNSFFQSYQWLSCIVCAVGLLIIMALIVSLITDWFPKRQTQDTSEYTESSTSSV